MIKEYSSFFKQHKYVVVPNFIDKNLSLLLYEYTKAQALRQSRKFAYRYEIYDSEWDGYFDDNQAYGAYSSYGDPLYDSVLNLSNDNISNITGLNLSPQYSYWRLYETGHELLRHKDRISCEISLTMCLGYDISNLKNKSYNWPMYVEDNPINLNPGDILIYKGCEVEHWRDKFIGLNHAQAFLHYNNIDGPFNNKYDGREYLGIPKKHLG